MERTPLMPQVPKAEVFPSRVYSAKERLLRAHTLYRDAVARGGEACAEASTLTQARADLREEVLIAMTLYARAQMHDAFAGSATPPPVVPYAVEMPLYVEEAIWRALRAVDLYHEAVDRGGDTFQARLDELRSLETLRGEILRAMTSHATSAVADALDALPPPRV